MVEAADNESNLILPIRAEQEIALLPSENRLDKDLIRKNCLISCRFILAA